MRSRIKTVKVIASSNVKQIGKRIQPIQKMSLLGIINQNERLKHQSFA